MGGNSRWDGEALSAIDWLMPRTYVRQILCFPSLSPLILETLRGGLIKTVEDVPYLAGGVLASDHPTGAVKLSKPSQSINDIFSWRDLSASLDYPALRAENFSPGALRVTGLIPPDTEPPFPDPAPVLRVALTLVNGGMLLCVAVHHCTTDITGFGALLKIWASHCRGDSLGSLGFGHRWLDRSALQGTGTETLRAIPGLLHARDIERAPESTGNSPPTADDFETVIFHFSHKTLQKLKTDASSHLESGWVSTNDIVTAILWSAIVGVEITTPANLQDTSTIGLPVNFRNRLEPNLPRNYLGAAFGMTAASASRGALLAAAASPSAQGLAAIASAVRKSLERIDSASVRGLVAFVAAQSDLAKLKLGPRHDGMSIVSWADEGVYELDWGAAVGRCESVRLPKLRGKRYPIILPRLPLEEGDDTNGGLEVLVSLEKRAMKLLKEGPLMAKFATVRCSA